MSGGVVVISPDSVVMKKTLTVRNVNADVMYIPEH